MAPRNPTFLSIFHDLNMKYKLGDPSFALERVTGDPGHKVFHMSLIVSGDWSLGIGVLGSAKTKKEAKQIAAKKILMEIRKVARAGRTLGKVSRQTILSCCSRMHSYAVMEEHTKENSAGALANWLQTRHCTLPKYLFLELTSALSGAKWTTCTYEDRNGIRKCFGDGISKKKSRNLAAALMLQALSSEDYYTFNN